MIKIKSIDTVILHSGSKGILVTIIDATNEEHRVWRAINTNCVSELCSDLSCLERQVRDYAAKLETTKEND